MKVLLVALLLAVSGMSAGQDAASVIFPMLEQLANSFLTQQLEQPDQTVFILLKKVLPPLEKKLCDNSIRTKSGSCDAAAIHICSKGYKKFLLDLVHNSIRTRTLDDVQDRVQEIGNCVRSLGISDFPAVDAQVKNILEQLGLPVTDKDD